MRIIDPIKALRLSRRGADFLRRKKMRSELAYANKRAATFPENPQYQERIRLSEPEIKTLNDALMEVMFPKHVIHVHKEDIGPECTQLASYMQNKIRNSTVKNARAKAKCE